MHTTAWHEELNVHDLIERKETGARSLVPYIFKEKQKTNKKDNKLS